MERVAALIDKLKQQYDQNVDKKTLMVTAQLLLAELEQHSVPDAGKQKVAVTLPRVQRIQQDLASEVSEPVAVPPPAPSSLPQQEKRPAQQSTADLPETIRSYVLKPPTQYQQPPRPTEKAPEKPAPAESVQESKTETATPPPPQPVKEPPPVKEPQPEPKKQTPVSSADKEVYELNDVHIDGDSLNDRLKEEKQELGASIKGDPVHDLRRAIGINDRYRFINELFRGDEAMYERSIKTINSFPNLAEAEIWIQRELKVKIGWSDANPSVKDFDQVVKRRFS